MVLWHGLQYLVHFHFSDCVYNRVLSKEELSFSSSRNFAYDHYDLGQNLPFPKIFFFISILGYYTFILEP